MDEANAAADADTSPSAKKGGSSPDIVIIAIDGSKSSEDAFDWYFKNLHRTGNTIIVVYGLEIPVMPTRESWDHQMLAANKKKEEIAERFKQKLNGYGVADGRFISGNEKPGEFIVDTARKENATYAVMGSRGHGKVRRTVLGSVSDFVVHHIHCPIVVSKS